MKIRILHWKNNELGAMGIGAMIVFIAMVLVAGIAAAVLIQTANRLEIQAMATGDQTKDEVSTGLAVFNIEGRVLTTTSKVVNLSITIKPRAGSGNIDLNNTIVEICNKTKKALLSWNRTARGWRYKANVSQATGSVFDTLYWNFSNEDFAILKLEDPDGSCSAATPVINRGDKVMLMVNAKQIFGGNGLSAREDVWGAVIPETGSTGVFSFRVPASLTKTVYDLY